MKKKITPYLLDKSDYEVSLSKFVGKKIVDITGYPSDPFDSSPLFNISRIIFDDGSSEWVEGEHDVAYIPSTDSQPNMSEDALREFLDEEEE